MTVVRLPDNIGAAGRTVGAEVATTPYLAFCDDDGWFEPSGLLRACDVLDQHPRLGLVNARILVGPRNRLDPISSEMAASPILDRHGLPGTVLLSFMAGAAIMRAEAFWEVGGYDERFFIGGEEETLALPLAKAGWQMRYLDDVVMHHRPAWPTPPSCGPTACATPWSPRGYTGPGPAPCSGLRSPWPTLRKRRLPARDSC